MKTGSFFHVTNRKKMIAVLKISLYFCDLAAITIYVLLRLLFKDFTFTISEDIMDFIKTIYVGTLAGLIFFAMYCLIEVAEMLVNKNRINPISSLKSPEKLSREIKMFDDPVQQRA